MEGSLDLGDELLGTAAEDKGAGLCCRAAFEEVEALAADLTLFKGLAGAKVGGLDVGAGGLDRGGCCLADTLHVVRGNTTSTEDVTIGKVSGRD